MLLATWVPMMKRRRFLAAVGTAFAAGCVSRGPDAGAEPTDRESENRTHDESTARAGDRATTLAETTYVEANTTSNDGTPTEEPTQSKTAAETTGEREESAIQRRVSLANVDDVPEKYQLSIDVKLLESTVTAEHTARLRVTTTNEGPKRKISIAEDKCSLFNRMGGLSEQPGLILHRPSSTQWIDRAGNRWVRNRPSDEPRVIAAYGCMNRVYLTGESVVNQYLVWDDYQVDGYLSPGTYRFAEPVQIKSPNAGFEAEPTAEFTWGFSLIVEKPQS